MFACFWEAVLVLCDEEKTEISSLLYLIQNSHKVALRLVLNLIVVQQPEPCQENSNPKGLPIPPLQTKAKSSHGFKSQTCKEKVWPNENSSYWVEFSSRIVLQMVWLCPRRAATYYNSQATPLQIKVWSYETSDNQKHPSQKAPPLVEAIDPVIQQN